MLSKIYQIKETCPMWQDGSGIPYERLLPKLLISKEDAEKYKEHLEMLSCEKIACGEYEIVELEVSNNYIEDIYEIHENYNDIELLEKCGVIIYSEGREEVEK